MSYPNHFSHTPTDQNPLEPGPDDQSPPQSYQHLLDQRVYQNQNIPLPQFPSQGIGYQLQTPFPPPFNTQNIANSYQTPAPQSAIQSIADSYQSTPQSAIQNIEHSYQTPQSAIQNIAHSYQTPQTATQNIADPHQTSIPHQPASQTIANPNTPAPNSPWLVVHPHLEVLSSPYHMANGDGPLTAIRLRASDGVLSQPPNDAMNTNQEHVFYVPVNRDSGYDNRYRKIMGDKLGQTLQLQLTPGTGAFVLEEWPVNYTLYKRVKSSQSRNECNLNNLRQGSIRADAHIFGHSKGGSYDHMNKATKHFVWLAGDLIPGACECGKCGRRPTNPYAT